MKQAVKELVQEEQGRLWMDERLILDLLKTDPETPLDISYRREDN